MKKHQMVKTAGKIVSAAMAAAVICMSPITASAAETTVSDLQDIIYNEDLAQKETLVVADDGMVEHICRVEDLDMEDLQIVSTPEEDVVSYTAGVLYNIDWKCNPNTRHVSADYKIQAGQSIAPAVVVSPADKEYWLGIMDDDGTARYITGRGAASHRFQITKTNRYYVFVQNNYKSTTLYATGYFRYD